MKKPSYEDLEKKIKKLQKDLDHIHNFELIVKNISTAFINMSPKEIDSGITGVLKVISEFIGSISSSVFLVSDDEKKVKHTHEWTSDPSQSTIKYFHTIKKGTFGYYQEKILRRKFVIVNNINDLPQKAIKEREWFKKTGNRPLLIIPMILKKKLYGFLSFSGAGTTLWSQELIMLIQIVADRFTNIIHRKKTELQLINSKKLSEALINATTDSAMLITTNGDVLAINDSFAARFGKHPEDLYRKNIKSFFHKGIIQYRVAQINAVIRKKTAVQFEEDNNGLILKNIIYPVFDINGNVDKLAFYSHDITDLKNAEKSIRYLTNELITAQEDERQKIACDLHDNIAQELACLRIDCETFPQQYPDIPSSAKKYITQFSRSIKNSIDSVRELAYELQPPGFDQMGFVKTIYSYCDEFTRKNGIRVDLYSAGIDSITFGFSTENNIHRLIQEALNNIKQHSNAKEVKIRFVATFPNIILRIEDDGTGFDVGKALSKSRDKKSMGLKSMEGRVKLQNGKFKIISRKNEGTKIYIEIPYGETLEQQRKTEEYYPLFQE